MMLLPNGREYNEMLETLKQNSLGHYSVPQRLENLEMVLCDQSWNFIRGNSAPVQKVYITDLFCKMSRMQNLSREMVLEI